MEQKEKNTHLPEVEEFDIKVRTLRRNRNMHNLMSLIKP